MMKRISFLVVGAASVWLACQGCQGSSPIVGTVHQTPGALSQVQSAAPLGAPCISRDEWFDTFSGFEATEVTVEASAACASSICLVNHMQGRASCPYGQTLEQAALAPVCFVPGTTDPIKVAVKPQLSGRLGDVTSICSCRCDGPGPGPFCACAGGMQCVPLVQQNDALGNPDTAGSYCIPAGTVYDMSIMTPECQSGAGNCDN